MKYSYKCFTPSNDRIPEENYVRYLERSCKACGGTKVFTLLSEDERKKIFPCAYCQPFPAQDRARNEHENPSDNS